MSWGGEEGGVQSECNDASARIGKSRKKLVGKQANSRAPATMKRTRLDLHRLFLHHHMRTL